jgi:hypothetical protein
LIIFDILWLRSSDILIEPMSLELVVACREGLDGYEFKDGCQSEMPKRGI